MIAYKTCLGIAVWLIVVVGGLALAPATPPPHIPGYHHNR